MTALTLLCVQCHPIQKTIQSSLPAAAGANAERFMRGDRWRDRQDEMLDPEIDAAKIRAFFIHPDWARQGIGTLLLDACEAAARAVGFARFELGATLTGAKLFEKRDYVEVERTNIPLEGDITLPIIHMIKETLR
jgi:GNAT superfamily N-acetyltransferase